MSRKEKFAFYLAPEKKALLERRYQEDGSRSLTAFIENAVDFYLDYLSANDAGLFLPTSIKSYLDGRLGQLEERLSSLAFRQAVEQDMRDTLENLYFGNITPNDQIVKSGTALKKAMEQSAECEEKLTALLEDKEKTLLLRLINAENEIGSTMALENFILGFRLGVRIILEALDEDDGSLLDPNKEE